MRLRRKLDEYYARGRLDGATGGPPDPFKIVSGPALIEHRDHQHLRRAYDAGFADGRRDQPRVRRILDEVRWPGNAVVEGD